MTTRPLMIPPGHADEDIGSRVIISASIFIVLEIVAVALRFISRLNYKAQWGTDDYLMGPALLSCLGVCVVGIVGVEIAGVGRHINVLATTDPEAVVNWAKCGYAIEQLYCVAVACPKLSILAAYLRIFVERPHRIASYVVGGIVIAAAVAGIITSLASCRPFSARWETIPSRDKCIDSVSYWQSMSVHNIVTDVAILVLPMFVIRKLQLRRGQKAALTAIFLLGSFGIVASTIRLAVTFRVTARVDGTFASADLVTWSQVEPGCYLVASCLPTYRPLVTDMTKRLKTAFEDGSRKWSPRRSGDEQGDTYLELV